MERSYTRSEFLFAMQNPHFEFFAGHTWLKYITRTDPVISSHPKLAQFPFIINKQSVLCIFTYTFLSSLTPSKIILKVWLVLGLPFYKVSNLYLYWFNLVDINKLHRSSIYIQYYTSKCITMYEWGISSLQFNCPRFAFQIYI